MADKVADKAKSLLDRFVGSVGDLLNDITALEVNTMIVAQITGAKFNAWEAYQTMYSVSDLYITNTKIPKDSYGLYENLFNKLERDYFYSLIDLDSGLENLRDKKVEEYRKRLEYLKAKKVAPAPSTLTSVRPILPDPTQEDIDNWREIQKVLNNSQFLLSLRKIIELKAALDSDNIELAENIDIIYAQTVMQLDGDVINRYHEKLFENEDIKSLILSTHKEGVESGEKQWRGLLEFMVSIVRAATPKQFPWSK